jgi:hypothetical protein
VVEISCAQKISTWVPLALPSVTGKLGAQAVGTASLDIGDGNSLLIAKFNGVAHCNTKLHILSWCKFVRLAMVLQLVVNFFVLRSRAMVVVVAMVVVW